MKKGGTKKKQTKQKSTRKKSIDKKWYIFGTVTLLLANFFIYQNIILPRQERAKFDNEAQKQITIANLVKNESSVTNNTEWCSFAGGQFAQPGRLYCKKTTAIYKPIDQNMVRSETEQIKDTVLSEYEINNFSSEVPSTGANNIQLYSFMYKDMRCYLKFNYPASNDPGDYLPVMNMGDGYLQTLISCSGKARKPYYQLVGNKPGV